MKAKPDSIKGAQRAIGITTAFLEESLKAYEIAGNAKWAAVSAVCAKMCADMFKLFEEYEQ